MKLFGQIAVHVRGEDILRRPGFVEKMKRLFGGSVDLRTGQVRAALEAATLVDAARDALRTVGVDNAVSLIVDDLVLYQDKDGRPDDLGDLFLAFHEQSAAIGGGFGLLRLTVEHVEAGLHMVIELQGKTEHAATDPAVRVIVSARLRDLEPRRGEDADTYRRRIEPIAKDSGALEVARLQFESFVDRARDAMAAALPDAKVDVIRAEAQLQRPPRDGAARDARPQDPRERYYDPYLSYYPSPFDTVLSVMLWTSVFSMMMPPHYTIINEQQAPIAHTDDPGAAETAMAHDAPAEAADPGVADGAVDGVGDAGAGEVDAGGGSVGGDDGGWGDWGGFDGGFDAFD